jgi:hypothetical protein
MDPIVFPLTNTLASLTTNNRMDVEGEETSNIAGTDASTGNTHQHIFTVPFPPIRKPTEFIDGTPSLIKPLQQAFHSTGALSRRIGHKAVQQHTPDTPIKAKYRRKPKYFSAPDLNPFGETPVKQPKPVGPSRFQSSFTSDSCSPLQSRDGNVFEIEPSTPTAPKKSAYFDETPIRPPAFNAFQVTPIKFNHTFYDATLMHGVGDTANDSTSPSDMDVSPVLNVSGSNAIDISKRKPLTHSFHLESSGKCKTRSPIHESPLHKRQHTDIIMGSPDDETDVTDTENRENTVIEFRKPSQIIEFRKASQIKPRPNTCTFPPSMIPIATPRKTSGTFKFVSKNFQLPNQIQRPAGTNQTVTHQTVPQINAPIQLSFTPQNIEPSFVHPGDTSHLSISDLQPLPPQPVEWPPTRRMSASSLSQHIPYYVLFSRQVVFLDSNFFLAADGKREALTRITATLAAQNESVLSNITYFDAHFSVVGRLGGGEFGDAYRVRSLDDGKEYAVKRSKKQFSGVKDAYVHLTQDDNYTGSQGASAGGLVQEYSPPCELMDREWVPVSTDGTV